MLLSILGLCFLGLGVGGLSSEYTLLLLIGLDRVVAMLLLILLSFEFLFFGIGRFGAELAGDRFISLEPERCGAFIVLLGGIVVAMLFLISLSFEFLFFGVGRFGAERAGGRFISLEPERCGAFIALLGGTGLFTVRIGGVGLFTVRVGGVGAFLGGGVGLDDCLCC